jgi:hypothetical protein
VQGIESPNAELSAVAAGQLGANVKNQFRHSNFHPQTAFPVLPESLVVFIGFTSREHPPKDVLFDGMGPLGNVKGRQPHDRARSH